MAQPKKWLTEVMDVIIQLGGKGHYVDIYKLIEQRRIMNLTVNKNWQAAVRQTIETHSSDSDAFAGKKDIFYSVEGKGNGIWAIRTEFYPKENAPVLIDIVEEEYKHSVNASKSLTINELKLIIEKQTKAKSQQAKKTCTKTTTYIRDAYVAEYCKRIANGVCQLCNQRAPFNDKGNSPYLESHHVVWLANGGSDTINNTVALCPNCHRKMHIINATSDYNMLLAKAKSQK